MLGKVKWYNKRKRFGFIITEAGNELFVHHKSIKKGNVLKDDSDVKFEITEGEKGPEACDVELVAKSDENKSENNKSSIKKS